MKKILLSFSILAISFISIAEIPATQTSIKDKLKQIKAKMKYNSEDYKAALRLYRDIYVNEAENALINFRIGQCHLALGNVNKSLEYFEKAFQLDNFLPGINKYLGQTYHLKGNLDKAVVEYNKYKATLSAKEITKDDVNLYLSQCEFAKSLMAKPIEVNIKNLGSNINTEYPDYSPSISLDGKTFIFTSRRSDTKGKGRDNYDHGYYEDIYISTFDKNTNSWSPAEGIKGRLNTVFHDASMSISPDGNEIYVYKNVPNKTRSGDIYVSRKGQTGKWSKPQPLPKKTINTSYFESSACLSADGNTLYFVSERNKGFGHGDIYMSKRISRQEWGVPKNLGSTINTEKDEIGVFIHPDGKTLFFSSKGHRSIGGYDIFRSVNVDGKWSTPENLGYPINTTGDDAHFVMTTDNKTGFYASLRADGFGEKDIYEISFENYDVVQGEPIKKKESHPLAILQGKVTDSQTLQGVKGKIYIIDPKTNNREGTTSTDADGNYFIIVPGNIDYEVGFSNEKFHNKKVKVRLAGDENATLKTTKNFEVERKEKLIFVKPELFEVQNILFKLASAALEISEDSRIQLDAVIEQLETAPSFKIIIHGHTDDMGKEKYNLELSLKRANFIGEYIETKGVDQERIIVKGFGSDRPIASNETEQGRAVNRRVEVKLIED
ncbi:MAG TPA: tetratricopeptide repeat protein [Flavobacteriales bacterium]|nr:tetratricopeptide repeat protein [Flavobacteriales bacterium]HIN39857.1 tetratricopeptide repeat protein [Flavobacteriales bacterium]